MRSFAAYRKQELKRELNGLNVREAVARHFEVLRLELLEAVKLPPMLCENSIVAEAVFERARAEDYEDNKQILEYVLSQYKLHFYEELLSEAETAAVNPFADLQTQMIAKVKELIQDLKSHVATILTSARPTDAGSEESPEPTASGATATPMSGAAPAGPASSTVPPTGSPPTGTGGAGTAGPTTPTGSAEPADSTGGGFKPAPMGSIRPSDGFFAGLKRTLYDPIAGWAKDKWRNFRRRWHNDPMREHSGELGQMFLENFEGVMDTIDNFEKDLLDYLSTQFDQIAKTAGSSAPAASTATAMPDAVPVVTHGAAAPSAHAEEPDPAAAATATAEPEEAEKGLPSDKQQPLEAMPQAEKAQEEARRSVAATKGAEMLGIKIHGIGQRGGWGAGVKPNSLIGADGQPVAPTKLVNGQQVEAGWARVRDSLYKMIYQKLSEVDPQVIENYKDQKRASGKKAVMGIGDIREIVKAWLKFQPVGSRTAIIDMLAAFYNKMSKVESGQTTPPVENAPKVAAAPQAEAPPAEHVPVTGGKGASDAQPSQVPVSRTTSKPGSVPADADGLVNKFMQDNPDLWNRIMHKLGGDESKLKGVVTADIRKYGDPQLVYDKLLQIAQKLPAVEKPQAVAAKAAPSVTPAKEAPAEPAGSSNVPMTQASDDSMAKLRKFIDSERHKPENADLADLLDHTKLSDEDLKSLLGHLDPNNPAHTDDIFTTLGSALANREGENAEPASTSTAPEPEKAEVKPAAEERPGLKGDPFKQLTANAEYQKLMQKYEKVVGDNEDNPDAGEEKAMQLEDELKKMVRSGKSVEDALAHLSFELQKEIERGDDPSSWMPSHGDERETGAAQNDRADKAGDSTVDRLQGMRRESFSHLLGKFRRMIHG